MIRNNKRFHATVKILSIIVFVLLCIASVSAITVSGSKYSGSILPGKTDTHIMTVSIGAGEKPMDAKIEVLGFGQSLDKAYTTIDLAKDTSVYSATPFITLDNTTVHLEPGIGKDVTAKISIPQDAGPGGRYALIYIHTLPVQGQSYTTAVLVPVMITISGTTPTETGSITDLSVGEVTMGQPITVTTKFKNTGDYHYYNTINSVAISDVNKNLVGSISTPPSIFAIIPGNTVQYTATPNLQNLPAGTYTVDSKILLENGKVLDEKTTTFTVKTNYLPPLTESNITLTPSNAGTLTSPDGRYSVSFPQGAVLGNVVVTLKPYSKDKLPAAPSNAKLGATSFEIAGLSGLLSKDASIKVLYSADDLAAASGDVSQLKLAYFNAAENSWVILPTQVNAQDKSLTTTTNHMGVWAVMVSSSITGSPASTTSAQGTPLTLTTILASLTLTVIAAGYYRRNRK